ncbi:MAG: TrkA C-terminal domain-containing protein [Acidimicrobiales bacterium]
MADAAAPPRLVLRDDTPLDEAREKMQASGVPGAPVVDSEGLYLGTADLSRVLALLHKVGGSAATGDAGAGGAGSSGGAGGGGGGDNPDDRTGWPTVAAVIDTTTPTVPDTARLDVALEALMQAGGQWVTVTSSLRVVGILSVSDLVRGYQRALAANTGQIAAISPNAVTIEERVGADSPVIDIPLGTAGLPPGCIVVSIQRGEHMLFATGSTVLQKGDLVSALARPTTAEAARRMLRGTEQPKPPMIERGSQMV